MTASAQQWIDRTRNALAFFLIGSFVGAIVTMTFRSIPSDNKDLLTYMVGQLSGMATMALGFYFTKGAGQDALDAKKSENTGKLADAVVAAAKGPSSDTTNAAADAVAGAAVDKAEEIKDA